MKRLSLVLVILFYSLSASASHLVGGVIYLVCNGSNQYQLEIVRYRDPTGASLPNTFEVVLNPINNPLASPDTVTMQRMNVTNISPIKLNPCHLPSNFTYERHYYESGSFSLAPNPGGYDIFNISGSGVGQQARNPGIDNIINPTSVGQTLHARIADPGAYPCNSSPQFVSNPPIELCMNDNFSVDYSAVDPDGDNVTYYLCDALDYMGYNENNYPPHPIVPYAAPFSGTYPLPATPAISIDPNTGQLTGTPNMQGVYVVTVCMEEWRNGTLIGQYRREIQLNVVQCYQTVSAGIGTDNPPNPPNTFGTILSCDDSTVHFQNETLNWTDSTDFLWDFGVQGTNTDTSHTFEPTFTFPDTGKYLVTLVTNPDHPCPDTAQAYALVYPYIEADFEIEGPLCENEPITLSDSSWVTFGEVVDWTWQLSDGSILVGENPPPPTFETGTHSVQLNIVSSKGCEDQVSDTFMVRKKPDVLGPSQEIICKGDSVKLDITTNGIEYEWHPKTDISCDTCEDPVVWPDKVATNYSVTVTNFFGCKTTKVIQVRAYPKPTVDAGDSKFYCDEPVQLEGDWSGGLGLPSFSWSPSTGLNPANGTPYPMASPGQTTTYTLTLSRSGCEVSDTVTVYTNDILVSATPDDYSVCLGESTKLNGSASKSNITYQWYPAGEVSDPESANPTVSPSQTTTYTFEVTDLSNGCLSGDTTRIKVDTPQGISAGTDTIICQNDAVPLSASEGHDFEWENHSSLSCVNCAHPTAQPASTTTYYLNGLDSNGCEGHDSVAVHVEPLPNVAVNDDTTLCSNTTLQLEASGGNMHVWSPANSLSCDTCANPVATPDSDTTYTVTAYSSFGCETSKTVEVELSAPPNVTAPPVGSICKGESVQLNASGGISYNWRPAASLNSPNAQNPVASPPVTTVYTVTGYDAKGCPDTAEVEVQVNVLDEGSFIADTGICEGESIELFAKGFIQYDWSPSNTLSCNDCAEPVATPFTTTTYNVAVEDENNCKDTNSVTIAVHDLPNATASAQEDTICRGAGTALQANGGMDYHWSPPIGLDDPSLPGPMASPQSSTSYTVEVTDINGCNDTALAPVVVEPRPSTNVEPDKAICQGDTTTITASGVDAYSWSGPGMVDCKNCSEVQVSPSNSAVYTVTGYLDNGCSKTAVHKLTVNPLPENVTVSADTNICQGDEAQLIVSGGNNYQWSPVADLSCTNCSSPIASPPNPVTYTVRVTNDKGCFMDTTTKVTVSSPATVDVIADTGVCPGNDIQLFAAGGKTYQWEPSDEMDDGQQATPILSPTQGRNYEVEIVDSVGCRITQSVYVEIYEPSDPMASRDTLICAGSQAILKAHNGLSYDWTPDIGLTDASSSEPVASPEASVTYTVEIIDSQGCRNTDEVKVTVQQLPNLSVTGDQKIYENSKATIQASGAQRYYWKPTSSIIDTSENSIVVFPEVVTTYTVTGVDNYGCERTARTRIEVVERPKVYVPNAFTPNNDGKNDQFIIEHNSNFHLKSLRIFNRWGMLIYKTTNPEEGWDGKANGVAQPQGVYVYQLIGTDKLGNTIKKKGNVTLIK